MNDRPARRPALVGARTQLSEDVAGRVREQILTGAIEPGSYVRIAHLSKQLQVSATPVREGLLILTGEGFLSLVPRHGFRVNPITSRDVADMYRMQAEMAALLAERAVATITEADIEELKDLQAEIEKAWDDRDRQRLQRLNHAWHRHINLAADSHRLAWLLAQTTRFSPWQLFDSVPGWPQASASDHRAILAAMRAQDGPAAAAAMHSHIAHAGALVLDMMDQQQ